MVDLLIEREESYLSPYATHTRDTRGRDKLISPDDIRTEYQRDRDRIIHSKAFRRLMHKTQVFLSPEADHYRTRLTHTLEVTQIARTIARALHMNEDLCEAIGLGHDLGHTPFGHAGERVLRRCFDPEFSHNKQSVRVVEKLENDGEGLNLCLEVKEGIYTHTWGYKPNTPEGKIVQFADKIAYINHDIDDACRAGILHREDIPEDIRCILGNTHGDRIDSMVSSIIRASFESPEITMEKEVSDATMKLRDFLFSNVYTNPIAKGEEGRAEEMLLKIYDHFIRFPEEMPKEYVNIAEEEGVERAVADYVSCMTDRYAINLFKRIFIPEVWTKL
ncbi:MAG: deoxyguanosinetriphosphate triphosphohydrolase [Ruminococcaceae bacterium]|nr:deoxyguanosinetriphosphate triphosphohydrolase [Oscillospiraceae bacterium]